MVIAARTLFVLPWHIYTKAKLTPLAEKNIYAGKYKLCISSESQYSILKDFVYKWQRNMFIKTSNIHNRPTREEMFDNNMLVYKIGIIYPDPCDKHVNCKTVPPYVFRRLLSKFISSNDLHPTHDILLLFTLLRCIMADMKLDSIT